VVVACFFCPGQARAQADGETSGLTYMTLREINEEIARREADLRRYQEQLAALERQNDTLRAELDEREQALANRQAQVRSFLRTLSQLTQGGYLQLLRGASNWIDLVRRIELTRDAVGRKLAALQQHQEQMAELQQRRSELADQLAQQQQLQERITKYREQLEFERDRRRLRWGLQSSAAGRKNVFLSGAAPLPARSLEL
jgi:peptidoglycan hydrolase CwlO-like protein